jgi:DNA helicase IV
MIFYSTPVGETRQQVEDRIITVSDKEPLLYIDLVTEGTIEEDILKSLMLKEGKQEMMRRIVRRLQKEA